MIRDVMRRKLDVRTCEECDATVTVNAENPNDTDQHHVFAFGGDGSGGAAATEYATYIFCSVGCLKEYCDDYFQRMLEPESDSPELGEMDLTDDEDRILHSEG